MADKKEENNGKGKARNAFFIFYATTLGLLAGLWGNLWATLFFERIIKGNKEIDIHFWVVSIILIIIIAVLVWGMIYFYKRIR